MHLTREKTQIPKWCHFLYIYLFTTEVEYKQKQRTETDRQTDRRMFIHMYMLIMLYGLNDKIFFQKKIHYYRRSHTSLNFQKNVE